jgi:hypothetical protein
MKLHSAPYLVSVILPGATSGMKAVLDVKILTAKIAQIYKLAGNESNFKSSVYTYTGHVYLPDM